MTLNKSTLQELVCGSFRGNETKDEHTSAMIRTEKILNWPLQLYFPRVIRRATVVLCRS